MWAAEHTVGAEVLYFLIDVGADVKLVDKMGRNILYYVINRDYDF